MRNEFANKNTSIINGQEVEIETKISVKRTLTDDVTTAAKDYIERIELMRQYISYYYNSPFMKQFKNEKDVRKPILQTNIIRKNPKYRKCFETFTFIERFESLGVSYKVDESYHTYTEKERKEINYLLSSQLLALQDEEGLKVVKEKSRVYKPKILTSIDDEKFCYGDLYSGPIQFVRMDEGYKKYLASQINKELPSHPTKQLREFYAVDYEKKRAILEELREIDKLISRVEKDIHNWEKTVQKFIKTREKEEAEEAQRQLDALRIYHQSLLEEKRKKIVEAASGFKKELKKENAEKAKEQQPVEEVLPTPEPATEEEPVIEEEPVAEPVEEAAPVEEIQPEPVVEEAPVEEEPQVEEEVPNEEVPTEEPVNEPEPEASTEEPIVEEQPQEEEIIENPVEEPAQEPQEEQVEEVEEDISAEELAQEETPAEEPLEEVKEEPQPVKKERKPRKASKKKAKPVEEKPQEEIAPVEEPLEVEQEPVVEEAIVEETPVEETPVVEEPQEQEAPKEEKKTRKPAKKKAAPKKKQPEKVEQPKVKEKKPKPEKEVIPGNFIVKTLEGYYINKNKLSQEKAQAKIFHNFVDAQEVKKKMGGKVVKL